MQPHTIAKMWKWEQYRYSEHVSLLAGHKALIWTLGSLLTWMQCPQCLFFFFLYFQYSSFIVFVIFGADVLFLKDEPNPKCFSRTTFDFTCFFETADNRTYNLFYSIEYVKHCESTELSVLWKLLNTIYALCLDTFWYFWHATDIYLLFYVHTSAVYWLHF